MAPKAAKTGTPTPDPNGIFAGMRVLLVESGVQNCRLQIWREKLVQMGATIEEKLSKKVTHVLGMDLKALLQQVGRERLARFKGSVIHYQWLEDSLRLGEKVSEDLYAIKRDSEGDYKADKSSNQILGNGNAFDDGESSPHKRIKSSNEDVEHFKAESRREIEINACSEAPNSPTSSKSLSHTPNSLRASPDISSDLIKNPSLMYSPPDLNKNITEIFEKLINIYRALGEDRRSFSYYKAIPVIEKLPFKIESADQVKGLPGIGKSMQDHIQEIVTTGKLSKLEHFEKDEKVRTISLFGEVWGIGPATALKLYEKGHRTLDDLKKEDSLTHSQRLGLKYFDDIKTRIPRHEVQDMECLLQKAGEEVLPGVSILCGGSFRRGNASCGDLDVVSILCGGSFRRGKASCGDLDVVITHPDGKRGRFKTFPVTSVFRSGSPTIIIPKSFDSHKGFLSRYVKRLKEMQFLREDLVFTTHSEQGADSGVDTYFGLCMYPGRELRHRIDFKVYPKDIYAFGLIAWTGNDVLNRRLRLLAESKGYRLDDTGLFPATRSSGGKQGVKGSRSLKLDTEKEVFNFLGFPWLEPHERNL